MFGLDEDSFMQRKISSLLGGKKFRKKINNGIKENIELFNVGEEHWQKNSEALGDIVYDMIPALLRKSTTPERLGDILLKNYKLIGLDKLIRKAKS